MISSEAANSLIAMVTDSLHQKCGRIQFWLPKSDANGNMVTKAGGKELWRFVWDYENRLTTASTRKQTVRYRYDALGRRVQRYFAGTKENTKFIYDGQDDLADKRGLFAKGNKPFGVYLDIVLIETMPGFVFITIL